MITMKLTSMTDFVLEQNEILGTFENFRKIVHNYANFLKQPLELWMFVPCDKNGNVIPESYNDEQHVIIQHLDYAEAKERCLFYGFEWNVAEFCDEPMIELEDKKGNYFCYDCEDKNFCKNDEVFYSDIEDLIQYNLQLTPTTIKQLGL